MTNLWGSYFKIEKPSLQSNDSALIRCLRSLDDNKNLFTSWVAKEMNLPILELEENPLVLLQPM